MRYIDAESLKNDIRPFAEYESNRNNKDWVKRVEVVIDNQPTSDVIEVVRCKDCVKREICRTTTIWAVHPDNDWFCADGERKRMKYNNESHRAWVVRMLQEIAETLIVEHNEDIEHIGAINYAIGYLIGIGWVDEEE